VSISSKLAYFNFTITKEADTDLQIVCLSDSRTGFKVKTALANPARQTPSIMAFAAARYSRSDASVEDILRDIKKSGKNAQQKLANIFKNYGHASVADMAQLFVYIENVPQLYATKFFYQTSLGGGQERSTRYQDFGNLQPESIYKYLNQGQPSSTTSSKPSKDTQIHGRSEGKSGDQICLLNQKFVYLQQLSLKFYQKWTQRLTQKYAQVYDVNQQKKSEASALTARVFDTSRYFLLNGICNRTSLGWITSAREWARIISTLKAEEDIQLTYLAEQLEYLLAPDPEEAQKIGYLPEAPDLIRYTKADETTGNNLHRLKQFLESTELVSIAGPDHGFNSNPNFYHNFLKNQPLEVKAFGQGYTASQKVVAQAILSIYPSLQEDYLFKWLKNLSKDTQRAIGEIAFEGFDHHRQMGSQFRVNLKTFLLNCSIAETRDLNRHRAWGRFIPALSIQDNYEEILQDGYLLPLYLTQNPQLAEDKKLFEADLCFYYQELKNFIDEAKNFAGFPKSLFLQLLPFANNMKMWLHGSIKETSYITNLRVRPGGHINYRHLAYIISQKATDKDPLLQSLNLSQDRLPNPNSKQEFLDRS